METNWENINVGPFQTGRLNKEYKNIEKYNEWDDGSQTNLIVGTISKYQWASSYTAINSDGEKVYILEYTRLMARKVDLQMFEKDPVGAVSNCGLHLKKIIDLLVRRFPLEKNFVQYWFELNTNEDDQMVSENLLHLSFYFPPDWDESVAENVPILQFCVETKDNTYYSHSTNPMHADTCFERNVTNYSLKKKLFVEGLHMVHRLLQFELFAELVTPGANMPTPVSSVIEIFILKIFNSDSQQLDWNDFMESLPEEMFYQGTTPGKRFIRRCLACEAQGQNYAIKVIKNHLQSKKTTKNLFNTLVLVSQMQNKNVVRQFDAWTSNSHYNWIMNSTEYDTDCETSSATEATEKICPSLNSTAQAQRIAQLALNEEYNTDVLGSSIYATAQEEHSALSAKKLVDNGRRLLEDHNYTFIVMQAAQQSLGSRIGIKQQNKKDMTPLKESDCIKYMKQFIDGLEYLNNLGFMHRDLKPDNALISSTKRSFQDTNGNLLISDLDTLKRMNVIDEASEILQQTLVKTPLYVSPEMASKIYNEKTDYYSIGISFAQILYPQHCARDASQMNHFLKQIHQEHLSETLHPQFAFLLRWLTEKDPTDRIGFLSFPLLKSLLQKHKYSNWFSKYENCYSVIIEHKETKRLMKCIRVANRKDSLREVIRRYSRRPEDYAKVLTKDQKRLAKLHEQLEKQERLANIYLRLENAKMLEFHGHSLVARESRNYVYVCCGFDEFKTGLGRFPTTERWMIFVLKTYYKTFVRWGAYSYSNIHRTHFKPDYFVIEPNLFDNRSLEDDNTGTTLLWPPEKLSTNGRLTEAGSTFLFGLFLLWNLLATQGLIEPTIRSTVKSLQEGISPVQLDSLEPYQKQLILWLCSFDPANRPTMENIPENIELQLPSSYSLPVVDEFHPYRVTLDPMDFCTVTVYGISTKKLRKVYFQDSRLLYITPNTEHKYIYTIANRDDVLEKVLTRFKICGNYKLLPRQIVTGAQQLPISEFMLDLNKNINIIVAPRGQDAVDWFMLEEGRCLAEIHHFGHKSNGLLYVHNSMVEALKHLRECHKRGMYHGNINYDTFLMSQTGAFCLSHPILVDENNEYFNAKAYHSDCTSPEQLLSGTGSPQSDIFALGVTLCVFIYCLNDEQHIDLRMFQKEEKLIFSTKIPCEYADLIRKMTCLNPDERINCEKTIKILQNDCSHHLAELREREIKLLIDKSKKTERQLRVAR